MDIHRYRILQSLILVMSVFVISFALYFEYAKGLQPCPLCLMQRLCAFLLVLCCLVSLCFRIKHVRILTVFQTLFSGLGLYFSIRQLWLQSLPPDQSSICMPGIHAMLRYFPMNTVMKALFWGTSECSEVTWHWLGLTMPGWSALYFLVILLMCMYAFGMNRVK